MRVWVRFLPHFLALRRSKGLTKVSRLHINLTGGPAKSRAVVHQEIGNTKPNEWSGWCAKRSPVDRVSFGGSTPHIPPGPPFSANPHSTFPLTPPPLPVVMLPAKPYLQTYGERLRSGGSVYITLPGL